jgi:uncharacterized pyridoxal phosphate-containing UPF0001 family protein
MLTAPQNPAARLALVQDSITTAADAACRDPASITLIGVAKSQVPARVVAAVDEAVSHDH